MRPLWVYVVAAALVSGCTVGTLPPVPPRDGLLPPRTLPLDISMPEPSVALRGYVELIAGPEVADCGHFVEVPTLEVPAKNVQEGIRCATAQAAARTPFVMVMKTLTIDPPRIWVGLIGTSHGSVLRFHYRHPECGLSRCRDAFQIERCTAPATRVLGTVGYIDCGR